MIDRDRAKAHSELQHALNAMGEERGKASLGPTTVLPALLKRHPMAAVVIARAAMALEGLGVLDKGRALPALRKLAPVMLDAFIEAHDDGIMIIPLLVRELVDDNRISRDDAEAAGFVQPRRRDRPSPPWFAVDELAQLRPYFPPAPDVNAQSPIAPTAYRRPTTSLVPPTALSRLEALAKKQRGGC